jgi:integrase
MADVIAILNWHSARSDDYEAPSRIPRRVDHAERPGRALGDAELRVVWQASQDDAPMSAIIRTLLLTAQRLQKVLTMKWADIDDGGLWSIPTAPREKNNAGTVRLPPLAIAVIRSQPMVQGCPFVFAGARGGHFNGVSYGKLQFDQKCAKVNGGMSLDPWVLHDLRRSARSALSELEVSLEVAEAVLGHARPGLEGTYNRATLDGLKAEALAKLARYIEGLVDPDRGKVIPFARTAG